MACWRLATHRRESDSRLLSPAKKPPGAEDEEGERVEVSVLRKAADDIPVVAVSGEVDVYSAPELKESLAQLLQSGAKSVVVDLTDVAFLDSTGLGALVEARAATGDAGGSMAIVCSHERILKLFTITGLDGVFSIHRSVDEALAAL
jgi:anti-sigma B factor antagonist